MPETSGNLWAVLSKAEPNVLLLAITAVLIVLILSLVFYLVYNKPRPDKRKSSLLSSSPLPASISAAAVSAAKKKKRPKSKPTSSKSKNIAPVDKMDDVPETEEEEEDEVKSSKAAAPTPAPAASKAAPAPAKAAGKGKKTEEEKALDELIAAEEKNNKDKKKKAAKASNNGSKAKEAPSVPRMDSHDGDDSDDDGDERRGLFVNAGKKSAAFEILQSGEGWAVVENRSKPKAAAPALAAPPAPAKVSENEVPPLTSTTAIDEPPAAVEEESAPVTPAVPAAPPAPVIETITTEMVVEAKKLGMLIGVKGATRIAIQKATETNIQMPKTEKDNAGPVTITVSGQAANVQKAVHAMQELLTKGYCTLIASEDFQESDVAIHPRYVQSIIGKGGAVIRALSNHTGVKITMPDVKAPGPDGVVTKVKVGLAGSKDKVALCRNLIKDLTRYYHTPITHPNAVHEELQIDEKYYSYIIGQKGSEIKHIQNNYKVSLHMPDKDTVNQNVVIVGEPAAVEHAKTHIFKLMQKKDERDNPPPKVEDEEDAAVATETAGADAAVTSPIGVGWGGKSPAAPAPAEGDASWNALSSPPPAGLTMDMSVFPPPVGTSVTSTAPPIGLPAPATKVTDGKAWNLGAPKTW